MEKTANSLKTLLFVSKFPTDPLNLKDLNRDSDSSNRIQPNRTVNSPVVRAVKTTE